MKHNTIKAAVPVYMAMFILYTQAVYAQKETLCIDSIEKMALLCMNDASKGLATVKTYYASNKQTLPIACLIQTEYLIGMMESQNVHFDSADYYLKKHLNHALQSGNDSAIITAYIEYGQFLRRNNEHENTAAKACFDKAWALIKSAKQPFKPLSISCLTALADYYNINMHDVNTATEYYNQAIAYIDNCSECDNGSVAFNNLGYMYMNIGYFEKAVELFYKALIYAEKTKKNIEEINYLKPNTLYNLSFCYRHLNKWPDAEKHVKEAIEIAQKVKATGFLLKGYRHYAPILFKQNRLAEAEKILLEAEHICQGLGDELETAYTIRLLGELYALYLNQPDKGLKYLELCRLILEKNKDVYGYHLGDWSLGKYYIKKEAYPTAISFLELAAKEANESNDVVAEQSILEDLYKAYELSGNYKNAFTTYKQYNSLMDNTGQTITFLKMKELEGKYNTQSKEIAILNLETKNTKQSLQLQKNKVSIGMLLGGGILVSAIFLLLYINQKRKTTIAAQQQELTQKRLYESEHEKQIEAAKAMVEGQEQERERIARDLHDGLGGLIAGTKLYLSNIAAKNNNPVIQQPLQYAIEKIDDTLQELRRVSKNLMPQALLRYGLKTALNDLCESLQVSGVKIAFQENGLQLNMTQATQITIYRVIQELLTNALKHAQAKQIVVQLMQDDYQIHITVEDDGKGFVNTNIHNASAGIGLTNIKSRVAFLKGKLDIQSQPAVGTTVNIELNVA
jgi:two-component system, NarL family, sensor kinase